MKIFRRIVFSLFVAAYLILCPLTILYAFGYSFRPGSEHGLVKTGLIYLSTTPPSASVYLGRRRFTQTTPAMLRGLLPGRYPVRVALKGYRSWEQVLPVEPEKATALEHILLLPQQLHPQVQLAGPFADVVPVPGTRFLLLAGGPLLGAWRAYDMKEGRAWPLAPESWSQARVLKCYTVKDSPWVLFRLAREEGERWLWTELRRGEPAVEDLTRLMLEPPEVVAWEPHNRRHLFAIRQGGVDRLDTAEQATSPRWLERARGFGLSGRTVYALDEGGRLVKMDRDGKETEVLANIPLPAPPMLGRPSFFRIDAAASGTLFLWGDRGELLTNRLPGVLAEKEVRGLEIPPGRQPLVVWTASRIGLVHVPEELFESDREAEPLRLQWIYDQGGRIEQVCWLDDGGNLLVRDGGRLFLLELGTYGAPRVEPLVDTADAPAAYAEETGTVHYLERSTGRLMALQILPRREVLPLPVLDDSGPRAR